MEDDSLLTYCGKINPQTHTLNFRNMSASETAVFMCKMLVSTKTKIKLVPRDFNYPLPFSEEIVLGTRGSVTWTKP